MRRRQRGVLKFWFPTLLRARAACNFHFSFHQIAPHPPLLPAYFSISRSAQTVKKRSVRFCFFAHFDLFSFFLFSDVLSSLSLFSDSFPLLLHLAIRRKFDFKFSFGLCPFFSFPKPWSNMFLFVPLGWQARPRRRKSRTSVDPCLGRVEGSQGCQRWPLHFGCEAFANHTSPTVFLCWDARH